MMYKFAKEKKYIISLLAIIIVHIFLLTQLIFHPYQELFTYPYFINEGLLPYKQILDQHFPGLMFFPINFATVGMTNEVVARAWLISIVSVTHILLYVISKRLVKSENMALAANMLYLVWQPFFEGWVLWIDSLLPLILLPAFYFCYLADTKGKRSNYFLSGLLLGLGIVFKQVVIPVVIVVGLIFLIKRKGIKNILLFGASAIILPLLMLLYFQNSGVLQEFWYWTVTYNMTIFSEYGRKYPSTSAALRLFFVYGFVVFSFFHISKKHKNKKALLWILVFLFASLASGFARFDYVHFQPSLPFVVLASVLALDYLRKGTYTKIILAIYAMGTLLLLTQFYKSHVGDKVFFFDKETKRIAATIERMAEPGERIFIFGSIPSLYQMSDTLPAGDIYIQQYSWFMMVSEQQILDGIVRDNPRLIVADRTVSVDGDKITDYSRTINNYIDENYSTVEEINSTEIMLRNDLLNE